MKHTKVHGQKPTTHGCIDVPEDLWVKNCAARSKLDIKTTEDAIKIMQKQDNKSIKELCNAFDSIVWQSIRYAHGRRTFAPSMVRDACAIRAKFGDFTIKQDVTLDPPSEYMPYAGGKLEDPGKGLPGDDLRDLMEKYKGKDNTRKQ